MEDKNRVSVLFKKYVSGEANKEEVKELLELIKSDNSATDLDGEMAHLWNQVQAAPREERVDWEKIYNRTISSGPKVKTIKYTRKTWLSAAAAILIGVFSMVTWFCLHKDITSESIKYVKGKAGTGKTLIVYLSDGSKVTLNSGTELRFPQAFNGKKREVYLNGEAYFEVAHDPKKPFIVHSGKLMTTVLGTSFNVMAYPRMSSMSVTVLSGKVAVKNTSNKNIVMLTPKQRAVLAVDKEAFNVETVKNAADLIAWRKGELIFNDATLEEIALKIGYRYGIKIDITNSNKSQKRITGIFNKQSFINIMDAITRLTGTQYKQTAGNYIIY